MAARSRSAAGATASRSKRSRSAASKHLFLNRDESWLRFNRRVLEEAQDATNPLLERLKFLGISASNLDEFTEVRVASILQRIEDEYVAPPYENDDGLSESERLDLIADQMHQFVRDQYACWNESIVPALEKQRIRLLAWDDLDEAAQEFAHGYFEREVDPLLTPVAIDPSHPFPRVLNKALSIGLLLRRKRRPDSAPSLGIITVPRSLSRLVLLPSPKGASHFLLLHQLIEARAERMFPGYDLLARAAFRVTRNSNLYLQEEESRSLLESVRAELHNRRKGDAVRLEIEGGANEELLDQLRVRFELDRWQVFRTAGPVNLARMSELYGRLDRPDLKYPKFTGREFPNLQGDAMFDAVREKDILLHHPFDSYRTVERFLQSAADDDRTVSMKQTLYRTSQDSPVLQALLDSAPAKDATVVVELMARFDEDSNIRWARALEDAGVQVHHGIVGQKTHAKLALLVRRDPDGFTRRYAHLGTGNYNSVTARFYTDISLLTADPAITAAVQRVFNYLTTDAEPQQTRPLLVAPMTLAEDVLALIHREAEHARAGRPARIVAKMNALLDARTIQALYDASEAGVQIDLIVRGMCSLRPGVPRLSTNIRVRSIVGRFLEHSRIFCFANGGDLEDEASAAEVYCGSADWMSRNLYERCEAVFPVYDPDLKRRIVQEILAAYLRDNVKARLLQPTGEYVRAPRKAPVMEAQRWLMEAACGQPMPLSLTLPSAGERAAKSSRSSSRKPVPAEKKKRRTSGRSKQTSDEQHSPATAP